MKIIKSAATAEDLKKINQFTRRELTAEEVYVFTVALCDNDVDRDYEKFTVEALKELQPLFIGKPGILDHSMRSEDQNSRVFETWVEQVPDKKTRDGEDLYQLKAKAYILKSEKSAALIDEIDAGIKKEVSVSCSMALSKCSICGKSARDDRCEHRSGQEYDGQLCFFTLEQPEDAYEFSFVAVPAQRGAGVTKSFDLEKGRECRKLERIFPCCGVVRFAEVERDGIKLIEELSPDALKGAKLNDVVLKDADGKVIARTKDGTLELKQLGESLFFNTAYAPEGDLYISFTGKSKTEFERIDGGTAVYRRTIQSIGKIYTISVDDGCAEKSVNSLFDGEIKKAQSERTEELNRKKLEAKKAIAKSIIGG